MSRSAGRARVSRRQLLAASGLLTSGAAAAPRPQRVAAAVTVYTQNSHADVILSRLLQTETLDARGRRPDLELAALYVDQFPANDLSRRLAQEHGFRIYPTIGEALTLGGDRLAVDGVLLIGEHGKYPNDSQGRELYPRRQFFDETLRVFRRAGRSVPLFTDKHLSHAWPEAKAMYDAARALKAPLMAGSSLPVTWRRPAVDVTRGARLSEAVAVSYHTLYGYGFHALEMVQCLAEQRRGGETGVRRVQCLEGPAVWDAGAEGRFDLSLLEAALSRLTRPVPGDPGTPAWERVRKAVPKPAAFLIEYRDGFKASVLTLNHAVGEWAVAWREAARPEPRSTLFWTQEARPFAHFTYLLRGIEQMIRTGTPAWPAERTLLTSGMLDFLLTSREQGGAPLETPELAIRYAPEWRWQQPPPPPPGRPLDQQ